MCDGIDGIVTIGGDGTFRGATDLSIRGIPTIGIPGTIDNDITASDYTIGFDTAMNTVIEVVDRLRDTCESHARCNVVEVMGRDCGDIALMTGIATGAVAVCIPEIPFDEDAAIEKINDAKAAKLYGFLDDSSFFSCPVKGLDRSRMNVVFRTPSEEMDAKFVAEATAAGLTQLKGHRLVGGCRASIYNAMPMEGVKKLVDFMKEFEASHT